MTVIFLILFFYFGVFSPLKNELEDSLNQNFKNSVSITEMNVENKLKRYKEGAESLSSRTMIKNKLAEYKDGEISFQELRDYTKEKYIDGIKVLENVVAAFRISEGETIVSWEEKKVNTLINNITYNNQTTELIFLIEECLVVLNSVIKKDNTKLGHDIVVFDLKSLMNEINKQEANCEIVHNKNKNIDFETEDILVNYRKLLNTNYWLRVETSKSNLYDDLNTLSFKIMGGFIFVFSIFVFIFFITLTTISKKIIKELEDKVKRITKISEKDEMLDIYNRSKFLSVLESEIYRSRRYNHNLSLIMIDIDYFKDINDEHGHLEGDKILIKISNLIKSEIREIDLFARYGGDEFMILNPETKLKDAIKLAERLRKKIEKKIFVKKEKVTCSFGVTELKKDDDIDSLLKRVDDYLYKAKEKRNYIYNKD
ncbi:MAG: GGDEF domain-containing protein [Thermotogota bacterium]